jgi:hypothetical protein
MRMTSRGTKYTVRFNSRSLIEWFGGAAKVHAIFVGQGADISQRTVEQWRVRDNIPAEAVATLLLHAYQNKIWVNIFDHLLERDE